MPALAPFLNHDADFLLDLDRVQRGVDRPVKQHVVGRVVKLGISGVHAEQIGGRPVAGEGIEVGAELHAVDFEVVDEFVGGEALGAIEHHVFQEMGEAQLVLRLLQGANAQDEMHFGALGRLLVMLDVEGEPVFQDALAHVRRQGQ